MRDRETDHSEHLFLFVATNDAGSSIEERRTAEAHHL
jgi:hypothetical protein